MKARSRAIIVLGQTLITLRNNVALTSYLQSLTFGFRVQTMAVVLTGLDGKVISGHECWELVPT